MCSVTPELTISATRRINVAWRKLILRDLEIEQARNGLIEMTQDKVGRGMPNRKNGHEAEPVVELEPRHSERLRESERQRTERAEEAAMYANGCVSMAQAARLDADVFYVRDCAEQVDDGSLWKVFAVKDECPIVAGRKEWADARDEIVEQLRRVRYAGRVKATDSRFSSLLVCPLMSPLMAITGDYDGRLAILDLNAINGKMDASTPVMAAAPGRNSAHRNKISCLKMELASTSVLSCSKGLGLQRLDLEKGIFSFSLRDSKHHSYFDTVTEKTVVMASEEGVITVVDLRARLKMFQTRALGYGALQTVDVNSQSRCYFLTAGTQGVAVWDMRKLGGPPRVVTEVVNGPTMSAFFSHISGHQILISTRTEPSLHQLFVPESKLGGQWKVVAREMVNVAFTPPFLPTWHPKCDELFATGTIKNPRTF